MERAAEEAWNIYLKAQEQSNDSSGKNMSAENLKQAYLLKLPELLKNRLEDTGVAHGMFKDIFKKQIGFSIKRMNAKLDKIDQDTTLSVREKNSRKNVLLKNWESSLKDYDRALTDIGTVDNLAMYGRYAQKFFKGVVNIVTAETIFLSAEKVLESLAHAQTAAENHAQDIHEAIRAKADATAVAHNPADTINSKTDIEKLLKHDTEKAVDKIKWWEHSKVSTPSAGEHLPTTPSVPHGITSNFSVKLGENGVPPHAETMFHEIAADHMQAPEGGMIDERFATKSLNIAANLVKLSEHHGVPGVSSEDFDRVASFKDGVLQVKDHVGFNQLLDKLQTHSDELWDKGTLQGHGAAISQIKNITHDSWLKIGHADGMPHDVVAGHSDITDVKNFGDSEFVKKAMEVGEAKAKVLSAMESKTATTPSFKSAMEHSGNRSPIKETGKVSPEDFLKIAGVATGATLLGGAIERRNFLKSSAKAKNPFNLPPEKIKEVEDVYEHNIDTIFSADKKDLWASARKDSAEELLTKKDADVEEDLAPLVKLLRKLYELTGLEPKSETLTRPAETSDEFMQRTLQKAAEMGELDKVKI